MPIISYTSVESILSENQKMLLCRYLKESIRLVLGEKLKEQTTITLLNNKSLLLRFDIELLEKTSISQNEMLKTNISEIGLTLRQQSVLFLVLSGKANKIIAKELQIAEQTVKEHLTKILTHFGVNNRLELVLFFANMGMAVGYEKCSKRE